MKKIIGIIVLICIVIGGYFYFTNKATTAKNNNVNTTVNLSAINTELAEINNQTTNMTNNILSVWEDTQNDGSITKKQMATVIGSDYNKFLDNTSEFKSDTYTNGLDAAKIVSAYYKNTGTIQGISKRLDTIGKQLDSVKDKQGNKQYEADTKLYNNIESTIDLLSHPSGEFVEYRSKLYNNEA